MRAYWFEPENGLLGYGDNRKPEVGKTHTVKCEPVLCNAGLHGSVRALDALRYAESSRLWIVEITGCVKVGDDKICGKRRKYIACADIEPVLREFARKCALDVAHLWDMPQIVREYLETGDEDNRAAADAAAWAAAAGAAACAAAGAAAGAAAWAAARAAAGAAARDAARAAAGAAARERYCTWLEKSLERVFI